MTPQQLRRIRQHAFSLWEAAGRPHGLDLDHWLQAEHEIIGKTKPAKAAKAREPRKVAANSPLAGKTKTPKKKAGAKKS